MEKRGVSYEPFIYIFIVIVAGLVFIFGFQQINKLNSLNEQVIYAEFQSDFKKAVEEAYSKNQGSVMTFSAQSSNKPLRLPKSIERIYFEVVNGETMIVPSDSKYHGFVVENLRAEAQNIKTNGQASFVLENRVVEGETKVVLKNV